MCGACLKEQVDVTDGIPKKGLVMIQVCTILAPSASSPPRPATPVFCGLGTSFFSTVRFAGKYRFVEIWEAVGGGGSFTSRQGNFNVVFHEYQFLIQFVSQRSVGVRVAWVRCASRPCVAYHNAVIEICSCVTPDEQEFVAILNPLW